MEGTVSGIAVRGWLMVAAGLGLDRGELLDAAGLAPDWDADSYERVPVDAVHALVAHLVERTGIDDLGLRLGTAGRWGFVCEYVVRNAPTAGEGFAHGLRYARLISDRVRVEWFRDAEVVRFRGRYPVEDRVDLSWRVIRQFIDGWHSALVATARVATGRDIRPVKVLVAYPEPDDTSALRELYRCPIEFNAGVNETWLDHSVLALPVVGADTELGMLMRAHAERELRKLPDSESFGDRARRALVRSLSLGDVSAGGLARRLGVSERTLQRRLAEAGTSFRDLLDQTRRGLAERYLDEASLTVDDIAFLLGYAEARAFQRAFKRWTGRAPSAYRE